VLDAKTLEPKRLLTYAKIDAELDGFGICAHPPKDRKRGQSFNYLISPRGELFVFGLDMKSDPVKVLWKTKLPCPPCYIHSLAMTDKYVVFVRNVSLLGETPALMLIGQPLHFDISDPNKPLMNSITAEKDTPTAFFVLSKADGKL
jgi:torulene dioxygenase